MQQRIPILMARSRTGNISGLVLLELLVIIAIFVLLAGMIPASFSNSKVKARRIMCTSNLKQIALSFQMYAGDNQGRMPWQEFSPNSTNVQTVATHSEVWTYFMAASNQLGSTKLLTCPADQSRMTHRADGFSGGTNSLDAAHNRDQSVSYFLGPHGSSTEPNAFMAGDRNLTPNGSTFLYRNVHNQPAIVNTNQTAWALVKKDFHETGGNYALYDGSVQQASTDRLRGALKLARDSYGTNANRLLFP